MNIEMSRTKDSTVNSYSFDLTSCRFEGEVDPPYEPAPLHLVTRIRSIRQKPWWDKEIMKELGLGGQVRML